MRFITLNQCGYSEFSQRDKTMNSIVLAHFKQFHREILEYPHGSVYSKFEILKGIFSVLRTLFGYPIIQLVLSVYCWIMCVELLLFNNSWWSFHIPTKIYANAAKWHGIWPNLCVNCIWITDIDKWRDAIIGEK